MVSQLDNKKQIHKGLLYQIDSSGVVTIIDKISYDCDDLERITEARDKLNIENEVNKSVEYCSEVMSEMYNMTIEKAAQLLWDSPFPKLIRKDPVSFGHFSFEDWSEETYKYHYRMGNI